MLQAQLRDFAELWRELSEAARPLQPPHCLELGVRRPAGSDQIGVIRIGEPVGAGFRRSHHCLLLQSENGVVRARGGEHSGNSVDAFGVGECGSPRSATRKSAPSELAAAATVSAPARLSLRTSRCGDGGALTEPAASSAPRR